MKNRRKYIIFDKTNAKYVRIFQARHRSTIDEYQQKNKKQTSEKYGFKCGR